MNSQQRKQLAAEEIWLHYFNNYLHDQKVISEREYLKMKLEIDKHCLKKRHIAERAFKNHTDPHRNGVENGADNGVDGVDIGIDRC